jgi:hypothetical protein
VLHARERIAARSLELALVEQLSEVGIGVDDADGLAALGGHGLVIPAVRMSEFRRRCCDLASGDRP